MHLLMTTLVIVFTLVVTSDAHEALFDITGYNRRTLNILTMGDSMIAGNGARTATIGGYRNYLDMKERTLDRNFQGCYRSERAWPGLYRKLMMEKQSQENITDPIVNPLHHIQLYNWACSGATIESVIWSQLKYVTKNIDMVFIMVGGNSIGFYAAVTTCFVVYNAGECKDLLQTIKNWYIPSSRDVLTNLLIEIRQRARSDTKIVFLGYPYGAIDDGFSIWDWELISEPPYITATKYEVSND